MAFWYNKPQQGFWTRTMSIAGAMLVVAAGAGWLWSELSTVGHTNPLIPESGWWERRVSAVRWHLP